MTEPILDESAVSEIEARMNAATPGPWGVLPSNNSSLAHVETQEGTAAEQGQGFTVCSIPKKRIDDAEFIAHAREDIPALCATVKHLRTLVYLPKILPDDEEVTFQEHGARLLREKLDLQSQLEQLRAGHRESEKQLRKWQDKVVSLMDRLAQVEQERDELRTQLNEWESLRDKIDFEKL